MTYHHSSPPNLSNLRSGRYWSGGDSSHAEFQGFEQNYYADTGESWNDDDDDDRPILRQGMQIVSSVLTHWFVQQYQQQSQIGSGSGEFGNLRRLDGERDSHESNSSNRGDRNGNNKDVREGEDPYEFVAFLLWYVFLVLCCIVPTCCAYRRRRMIERRIVEQQANMAQFQQANLFFLNANNNASRQSAMNEEALQQQRHVLLTESLKPTTIKISSSNLKEVDNAALTRPMAWNTGPIIAMHDDITTKMSSVESGEMKKSDTPSEIPTAEASSNTTSSKTQKETEAESEIALGTTNDTATTKETGATGVEENHDEFLDLELESNTVLLLPAISEPAKESNPNSQQPVSEQSRNSQQQSLSSSHDHNPCREVAGVCAICLSPYEVGDQVTWAASNANEKNALCCPEDNAEEGGEPSSHGCCPHAFHTDCIIGWLSKKECPKCPVCRQSFCQPVLAVVPPEFDNNNNNGTGFVANDIPFPFSREFSRSLAESVAMARFSIVPGQQQQRPQTQQPANDATAANAARTAATAGPVSSSQTTSTAIIADDRNSAAATETISGTANNAEGTR